MDEGGAPLPERDQIRRGDTSVEGDIARDAKELNALSRGLEESARDAKEKKEDVMDNAGSLEKLERDRQEKVKKKQQENSFLKTQVETEKITEWQRLESERVQKEREEVQAFERMREEKARLFREAVIERVTFGVDSTSATNGTRGREKEERARAKRKGKIASTEGFGDRSRRIGERKNCKDSAQKTG
jgi:hypothetical protein